MNLSNHMLPLELPLQVIKDTECIKFTVTLRVGICTAVSVTCITVFSHSTEILSTVIEQQPLHCQRSSQSIFLRCWKFVSTEATFILMWGNLSCENYLLHPLSRQLSVPVHLGIPNVLSVTAVHGGRLTLVHPQQRSLSDITPID